ncbi:MAG: cytochrome ubiquinol oxidase subunit I [Woeseiaceae bacterium]|jgi:cytochrome d ubiquinol oxidase subunit I|nr:cytochrome ubiquinol oxidase subunit I [Woeseiaceae bacterium]
MESLLLARIQFAANISFHIIFPMISIALTWLLLFFKLRYNKTGEDHWMNLYRLFVKVFALTFALGVVSGITMSFQFGTNWPGFMETVGNIAGPMLAYEVLTAFFLEASFLGIMLFGFKRVSNRIHTLATLLVAIGTTVSAFWILALNSWMHTPAGFEMIDGQAHATDWFAIVFNPSFPYRLVHTVLASGLTAAFLVAGLSAYRWLLGDREKSVLAGMKTGLWVAAALIPIQIVAGDFHGLNTLEHQPAKVAAMEGLWETTEGAPLVLFGIPDKELEANRFAIEIPKLASLILTHELDGEVKGINEFDGEHPPVAMVFWAFRIMVGTGVLMLLVSWYALWALRRQREPSPWLTRALVVMTFSGWVAVLSGWYTTEIGRQPYLVQGIMTTADALGPTPAGTVMTTLVAWLVLYGILISAYIAVVFGLARNASRLERLKPGASAHGPQVGPLVHPHARPSNA